MNRNNWLSGTVKPQLGDINIAIEVGVWEGAYSHAIIQQLQPKNFYGVDPYEFREDYADAPDSKVFSEQSKLDGLYQRTQTKLDHAGHSLIRDTGINAAKTFDNDSLDFVYIDGDHSYDFVSNDIKAWWPKIKQGGILSGHDYTPGNPQKGHVYGVIEAVTEHAEKYSLNVQTTNEEYATWWVTKE